MINHNPNNVQVGEWAILDDNEENLVRVFNITPLKMFSEVGSDSSRINTWEVMTYRLKPLPAKTKDNE